MSVWSRDPSGRLKRVDLHPQSPSVTRSLEGDFEEMANLNEVDPPREGVQLARNDQPQAPRTLRDYLNPLRQTPPSCIVIPPNLPPLHFKPGMAQMIPKFYGMDSERPYQHLKDFEEMCIMFHDNTCTEEHQRLRLFPFSLQDKAKVWLNNLRPRSITSWAMLQAEFLRKFFPEHRTDAIRRQISQFAPHQHETIYQCWERYKELLNSCPHHAMEPWRVVSIFYSSFTPQLKRFVETICNGQFDEKTAEEALEFFDFLADNARDWDTTGTQNPESRTIAQGCGKYTLREADDLNAKITALTHRFDQLESKKVKTVLSEPEPIVEIGCMVCDSREHGTDVCPSIPVMREVLQTQAQAQSMNTYKSMPQQGVGNPFAPTYNSGWRNHPNFGWKNEGAAFPQPYQASQPPHYTSSPPMHQYQPFPISQPPKKSLEDVLTQFMQSQENVNAKVEKTLDELKNHMGVLAQSIQEKGRFPAQPQPNPSHGNASRQVNMIHAIHDTFPLYEHVEAITTLRSGKQVDKTIPSKGCSSEEEAPTVSNTQVGGEAHEKLVGEEVVVEGEKEKKEKNDKEELAHAPFPHRLKQSKNELDTSEIYETFKQVKINIPLLDAIKQIPSYAKYLKDLCTIKRKLKVKEKSFLATQVSAILQLNTPPKYKDPGCPTIACQIGNHRIGNCLLDLGASVNLLPYSVYRQLGLGELRPTRITLQLADRSMRVPRGVVEDVLIQVDKFYFPVDFVVIDTEPMLNADAHKSIPVILGRPFLATSNALINCRNGVMKISFGNMTAELNIFNVGKIDDKNDFREVHLIQDCKKNEITKKSLPNESDGGISQFLKMHEHIYPSLLNTPCNASNDFDPG